MSTTPAVSTGSNSRVFPIDRRRFERVLPLRLNLPERSKIKNHLTRSSTLPPWDDTVGNRLEETPYNRVDLDSPHAWTLHPILHGQEFFQASPFIIKKIEGGWYPHGQAGYFDLRPELWLADNGLSKL